MRSKFVVGKVEINADDHKNFFPYQSLLGSRDFVVNNLSPDPSY